MYGDKDNLKVDFSRGTNPKATNMSEIMRALL